MLNERLIFLISSVFVLIGILIFIIGVIGIFRVGYILNRLHIAAMLDSCGLLFMAVGIGLMRRNLFEALKLASIIALFWIASPVCSHLLSALEVATNKDYEKNAQVLDIKDLEGDNK